MVRSNAEALCRPLPYHLATAPERSWYGLALGCALTRVASGAHFLSDVVLAALVGYVVTLFLWARHPPAHAAPTDSSGKPR